MIAYQDYDLKLKLKNIIRWQRLKCYI
jgi:hypothetical protein